MPRLLLPDPGTALYRLGLRGRRFCTKMFLFRAWGSDRVGTLEITFGHSSPTGNAWDGKVQFCSPLPASAAAAGPGRWAAASATPRVTRQGR